MITKGYQGEDINDARNHLVLIRWADHYNGDHAWTDIKQVQDSVRNLECETTGYLLCETKDYIKVCSTVADTRDCCDVFTIMKALITERIDFYVR